MRRRTDTVATGIGVPTGGRKHPFESLEILRTPSVSVAQSRGSQLLGEHRIRPRGHHFDAKIYGASSPGFSLYYMSYGAPLTVVGELAAGWVGVALPIRGSMRIEHMGTRFVVEPGRSAAVFSPSEPLQLDWSDDLEFLCFRIAEQALQEFFHSVEHDSNRQAPIRFVPNMTDRTGLANLLSSAKLVERTAHDGRSHEKSPGMSSAITTRLRDHVMTTLALTQPRSDRRVSGDGDGGPASTRAARRAHNVVEEGFAPLTPSELAKHVGVRLRTLQIGFRSEFGVSPQAYLSDVRIRRAHADLTRADSRNRATVASIAARWGFTNMGRFSEQYRRAFGQSPSETLREAPE